MLRLVVSNDVANTKCSDGLGEFQPGTFSNIPAAASRFLCWPAVPTARPRC